MILNYEIITDYPLWFSIFCVLAGSAYATTLYFRDNRFTETPRWLVWLMISMRFLLVSVLAFLLLSPYIKTWFNRVEKPIIIIAQDNSSSILLNKDSTYYRTEYLEKMKTLSENLRKKYEVKRYVFDNKFIEGKEVDYSGKTTNLSKVFDEVDNKFYNRNIGALILASDGIFNQGSNPNFDRKIEFPVYTIALGDTTTQRDLLLNDVASNKITFLGNQFPIEIDIGAYRCANEKVIMTITQNGEEVFKNEYKVKSNQEVIKEQILFKAKNIGVQHYRIELSPLPNEISKLNNTKDVYVEVLDDRQKVLILSDGPHPDIKALRLSIENNENYKVTTDKFRKFDGNFEPYSLIIVHEVTNDNISSLVKLLESNVSVLFILGSQTEVKQFNLLDVGLKVEAPRKGLNEVLPSLRKNFPLFTLGEKTAKTIKKMPPLLSQFGAYSLTKEGYVLMNQKIGSVETDAPLICYLQDDGKKYGIISGEGIWKWRMYDFNLNKEHSSFNELMNKTVQFLSVKENKSRFRVETKDVHMENEEVKFKAELYNESYELINDPEVKIELKDANGKKYDFVFNKTLNSYVLNSGLLPAGFYSYVSFVPGNSEFKVYGKLQVKPLRVEANNTTANYQLMQNIAKKYGGKLFYPEEIEALSSMVKENQNIASTIYEENDLKEMIHLKWIFFVLLSLLGLEWFIRKYNGAY